MALLLGGCATSHIGSEWPCPASQGTPCTSVAAADPARAVEAGVQDAQRPVNRTHGNEGFVRASESEIGSEPASSRCSSGCRPFVWLRRLGAKKPEASDDHVEPAAPPIDPAGGASAQPPRTQEVIGRIWIAPYVDDSGVYHEARWVQAVLEPAGWRLP